LINVFDTKFDYPSGETTITDMYDLIEQKTIQDLDIGITYGIDMQRIKEDLQKLPVINFYKQ
jgi:RecJ-like exonuclease